MHPVFCNIYFKKTIILLGKILLFLAIPLFYLVLTSISYKEITISFDSLQMQGDSIQVFFKTKTIANFTEFASRNVLVNCNGQSNVPISVFLPPDALIDDEIRIDIGTKKDYKLKIAQITVRGLFDQYTITGKDIHQAVFLKDMNFTGCKNGNAEFTTMSNDPMMILNRSWPKFAMHQCCKPVFHFDGFSYLQLYMLIILLSLELFLVFLYPAKNIKPKVQFWSFFKSHIIEFVIVFFSFLIFLYFLTQNYCVSYGDEYSYFDQGKFIFTYSMQNLRTYLYPLIISLFNSLVTDSHILKMAVSFFQYFIFAGCIVWIMHILRKHVFDMLPDQKIALSVSRILFAFLLLNPYLIQAATLFLTDSISSSFVAVAILYFIFEKTRGICFDLCWGLLFAACMIRPGMLYFVPIAMTIYTVRFIANQNMKPSFFAYCKPFSHVLLLGLLLIFPQVCINQVLNSQSVKFPIVADLLQSQKTWGFLYLKYATCVKPDQGGVYYKNIFNPSRITDPARFRKKFKRYFMTRLVHVLAMADQGEVDSYIISTRAKKNERIIASIIYYLYLFLAVVGIVFSFLRKNICRNSKLDSILVLFTAAVYLFFYSAYAVESRFFYPVMLLLSYFCAVGIANIFSLIRGIKTNTEKAGFSVKYFCLFAFLAVIFETASFTFSYWLDSLIF